MNKLKNIPLISYRAIKFGIPLKDDLLLNNKSSFKWIFARTYLKTPAFLSFDYNLQNTSFLIFNKVFLLKKLNLTTTNSNVFLHFLSSAIFFKTLLFLKLLFLSNLVNLNFLLENKR